MAFKEVETLVAFLSPQLKKKKKRGERILERRL